MVGTMTRAAWRRSVDYEYLRTADKTMFAWEWLRRTAPYRRTWLRTRMLGPEAQARAAQDFGLVDLPSPRLNALVARPIWRAACDPHVLRARVLTDRCAHTERFDIRQLADDAAIALDDEDAEHWRFGLAGRAIRVDVHGGTLLGGPTLLQFELVGLAAVRPKLAPLDLLVGAALMTRPRAAAACAARTDRWIAELRAADALAAGASQQDIARALFSAAVPPAAWRAGNESYRLRAQRLVRAARARLRTPLDPAWFR